MKKDNNICFEEIPSLPADEIVATASNYRTEAADEASIEDFESDAKTLLQGFVPGVDRYEEVAAEAKKEGDDKATRQRRQKVICRPWVHFMLAQPPETPSHLDMHPGRATARWGSKWHCIQAAARRSADLQTGAGTPTSSTQITT